ARRVAYTMDASWIVVYVENSPDMTIEEKEQLKKNFKLARELGAEVMTTSDDNIADGLIRVAREQNASQILVGKPNRLFMSKAAKLVDELIEKSGDLDIYIVGQETKGTKRKVSSLVPRPQSSLSQYFMAVALVLAAALLCVPIEGIIGYRTVSFILLFVVTLLPLKVGPGPTVLAAAIGALSWDFLFIPPRFTLIIGEAEDTLLVGMFFLIATVTGVLSARVRKRERLVRMREQNNAALFALTRDLSSAHSQDEVIQRAISNIKKFFDADVAVFLGDAEGEMSTSPHPASTFKPDSKEFSIAAWVYWNEKKAGRNTDTLPSAQATYIPMSGPRYPLGVIGVKLNGDRELSFDEETLLENFISQITTAVERELLNEINRRSIVIAESEKLYKTLFDSISHEFRTPISTILGLSENLLSSERVNSGSDYVISSLKEINIAAERLNRLVANLMDITRLESGLIKLRLDWCNIRDVIAGAIKELEKELEGHKLTLNIPETVPLMKLDFGLIQQVFTNLVHNACVHTPPGTEITIDVSLQGGYCVISVSDNGRGIPEQELDKVFDKFHRVENGAIGGIGLGLAIAKGFVEAHHGTISVQNRPEGGVTFTVKLPVIEDAPRKDRN
ncbi:MAG: ATP-binding protein, partial [Candidatus Kryptoniota bacterium]